MGMDQGCLQRSCVDDQLFCGKKIGVVSYTCLFQGARKRGKNIAVCKRGPTSCWTKKRISPFSFRQVCGEDVCQIIKCFAPEKGLAMRCRFREIHSKRLHWYDSWPRPLALLSKFLLCSSSLHKITCISLRNERLKFNASNQTKMSTSLAQPLQTFSAQGRSLQRRKLYDRKGGMKNTSATGPRLKTSFYLVQTGLNRFTGFPRIAGQRLLGSAKSPHFHTQAAKLQIQKIQLVPPSSADCCWVRCVLLLNIRV